MNTLPSKWYRWTLATSAAVLVLSVSGLLAVWLSPGSPPPRYLVVPKLTDPRFTLQRHQLVDATSGKWVWSEEAEIPPETGRKILGLLRGSPTWGAAWDEYHRRHPEEPVVLRQFNHTPYYALAAYEGDSARPKLAVTFHTGNVIWANDKEYVVRQSHRTELRNELAMLENGILLENEVEESPHP